MSCSVEVKNVSAQSLVVEVDGEVDFSTVDNVLAVIEEHNEKTISIDCSGITFIDSTGIGLLLRSILDAKDKGGDITLNLIPPQIHEVLNEMGIFDIIDEFNERRL